MRIKSKRKRNVLLVLSIYILIMFIFYIYCLPDSNEVVGEVMLKSIISGLFGLILISQVKLLKWTGGLDYAIFKKSLLLIPFTFSIPIVILTAFLTIKMIMTKQYEFATIFSLCISVVYGSYKAYYMNRKSE